jgi:hypothetical protein
MQIGAQKKVKFAIKKVAARALFKRASGLFGLVFSEYKDIRQLNAFDFLYQAQ